MVRNLLTRAAGEFDTVSIQLTLMATDGKQIDVTADVRPLVQAGHPTGLLLVLPSGAFSRGDETGARTASPPEDESADDAEPREAGTQTAWNVGMQAGTGSMHSLSGQGQNGRGANDADSAVP